MERTNGCEDTKDIGQLLADRANSFDAGEMVEIIAKTPFGIEWRSSLLGDWFMHLPSVETLVKGWNGEAQVHWFWDAHFADESTGRAVVVVPPSKMQEIKDWLESLEGLQ